ncbi:hypothetical protein ACFXAP_001862 [Vibrio cholerae]
MKDDAMNPTLNPFGESSIKSFIKSNYNSELEGYFSAEKQRGFEEGRKQAVASLEKDRETLRNEIEKFQKEVSLFNKRKSDVEEKERHAIQRVEQLIVYLEETERALVELRKDARADIIFAISNVFKSVYNTEETKRILLHGIHQALDTLSEPSIEIEVNEICRSFVEQALVNTPAISKIRVNQALTEEQARIFTSGICIDISTGKNREIFKQNLLEAVNGI